MALGRAGLQAEDLPIPVGVHAGGHEQGNLDQPSRTRIVRSSAALEQPIREVAALAKFRDRDIDGAGTRIKIPVTVRVTSIDPAFVMVPSEMDLTVLSKDHTVTVAHFSDTPTGEPYTTLMNSTGCVVRARQYH